MQKIGLRLLTLCFVLAMLGASAAAQTRINFRRGADRATVSGRIGNNGYREYLIRGRAGQVMTIVITSGNGRVSVNGGTASGKNFSIEMSGGDHLLSVVNEGGATSYTMTVRIR